MALSNTLLAGDWTLGTILVPILILTFFFPIAWGIYNVFFHPLASIPGPWSHAASHAFQQYHEVKGTGSQHLEDLHARYGPVVRFEPDSVSYIKASAWKEINGPRVGKLGHALPRSRANGGDLQQFGAWNILLADHEDHVRQRRQLNPGFSDKSLREQEPLIMGYVNLLMKRIEESGGQAVDMSAFFNYATFDIVGELAFGANEFQSLDKMRSHEWVAFIFALIPALSVMSAIRKLTPWIEPLLAVFLDKKTKAAIENHPRMTIAFVDKRLDMKSDKPDFINYIMRETKSGPSSMLENREIYATSAALVIAGSETTATAMSATLFYLARTPDKLAKLRQEIRDQFASADEIDFVSAADLKYLSAVINEVLRLYPPAPQGSLRHVGKGGCVVDGKFIPEGSNLVVPHYPAFRSETNFKDAKSFVPERWLGDQRYANDNRQVFHPFGFGPWICIGVNLANVEMRVILAKLIWNFDMELAHPEQDWVDQKGSFIWWRPPLMVKLTKRKSA